MSDFRDDIYPGAGQLNWDDDVWTMPRHHSRYINNIVVNDDGNQSMAVNSPGNELVDYSLPSGAKVLASVEDTENNSLIYFVYNNGDDHLILEYSLDSESISVILDGSTGVYVGSALNFKSDEEISVSIFGSGDEKYIVWTSRDNGTRIINKKWAKDFTDNVDGIQGVYNSLTFSRAISLIKQQPDIPGFYIYDDDDSPINNVAGDVFQFAYRWGFDDNSHSVFSELNVAYPLESDLNYIRSSERPYRNNTIFVEGSVSIDSKYADIVYRRINVDGTGVGNFFKYDTINCFYVDDTSKDVTADSTSNPTLTVDPSDINEFYVFQRVDSDTGNVGYVSSINRDDNTVKIKQTDIGTWGSSGSITVTIVNSFVYPFKNDLVSIPISNTDVLKQYENIPISSRTLSIINSSNISGTRLSLFDNESGYDVPDVSVDFEIEQGELSYRDQVENITIPGTSTQDFDFAITSAERLVTIVIGGFELVVSNTESFSTTSDFLDDLVIQISNSGPNVSASWSLAGPSAATVTIETITGDPQDILWKVEYAKNEYYDETTRTLPYNFKSNQTVSMGIIYKDEFGRSSNIARDNSFDIYVPHKVGLSHNGFINAIQYSINHRPPSWAKKWCWAMSTSNLYDFYTLSVYDSQITRENGFMQIDLLSSITAGSDGRNLEPPDYFQPVAGDRITFAGYHDVEGDSNYGGIQIKTFDSVIPDVDIVEYDSGVVTVRDVWDLLESNGLSTETEKFIHIEVYRPKKDVSDEDAIFFQVGDEHDVVFAGADGFIHTINDSATWFNSANTQDQTESQPCIGYFDFGNSWIRYRDTIVNAFAEGDVGYNPGWVESRSFFMNKDYDVVGEGKLYLKNDDVGRETRKDVVWSGLYDQESGLNNIRRFDFEDYKLLDERYGAIHVADQIGNVLLTIQEDKTNSIYLTAEQGVDAAGDRSLSYSNNVIGSINPSPQKYGTKHPKSYDRNSRNAYWFDLNNADVVRYATNGMHPLGELYKMKTYFREKAREIIDGGVENYDVIGKYDEYENMYKITFIDKNTSANSETLAFYEPQNKWVSFYDYQPELYGKVGSNEFVSFLNGELYVHGTSTRNTFYGAAFDSEVWILSNLPQGIKVFDSIEVNSNDIWTAPDNDSVVISPTALYPNGMQSRLKDSQFENREGVYEAPFLRDMLTTSSSPKVFDLLEGRELRGREITVKLKNSSTSEVRLFSVHINSSKSM